MKHLIKVLDITVWLFCVGLGCVLHAIHTVLVIFGLLRDLIANFSFQNLWAKSSKKGEFDMDLASDICALRIWWVSEGRRWLSKGLCENLKGCRLDLQVGFHEEAKYQPCGAIINWFPNLVGKVF